MLPEGLKYVDSWVASPSSLRRFQHDRLRAHVREHGTLLDRARWFTRDVTIEFPYNSYAGTKTIDAEFNVQAGSTASFSVPVALKLGLSDVGMQTLALRDGSPNPWVRDFFNRRPPAQPGVGRPAQSARDAGGDSDQDAWPNAERGAA